MPFRSEKQREFMYAVHPDIAKRWAAKYGTKPVGLKNQKEAIKRRLANQKKNVGRVK